MLSSQTSPDSPLRHMTRVTVPPRTPPCEFAEAPSRPFASSLSSRKSHFSYIPFELTTFKIKLLCKKVGEGVLELPETKPAPQQFDTPLPLINNRCRMIGLLRGHLAEKRPNQVLLDVGGVGYQVSIPLSTFYALGELREDVTLLIYTHVREDQLALYGFLTSREKHFFELLLSASGVGPTLALKILSGMSVDELVPAIRSGDLVRLTSIPGVGRKTAERIVVELRDRLAAMETAEVPERSDAFGGDQLKVDVLSALLNLGYDRRTAEKGLAAAADGAGSGAAKSFEALLRAALQQLSQPAQKGARGGA